MSEKSGVAGALLAGVTLAFTILGAGVAFLEYRDAQQRERIERVFRYSDRLAEQTEANAYIDALSDAFVLEWRALAASAGPEASPDQLRKIADDWFVNTIGGDPELRRAVDRMAQFYDTLAVCVSQELCDEPTAKALFTQNVAGFASTVYPWVAHRKREFFAATGIPALCLRNRFCGGVTECSGVPESLLPCDEPVAATPAAP